MFRDAIDHLPPELTGGLTFHLPMELRALDAAGATDMTIAARTDERLAEAFARGMIDPPLYRWAVERYRSVAVSLTSPDVEERVRAFAAVAPLGDGLAGAAFHGLIRLGYAAWRKEPEEVARGLGYLRTRRQVLSAGTHAEPGTGIDLPTADDRVGVTVFDLLNIAAGTGEPARRLRASSMSARTVHAAVSEASLLVRRNPSSFVAVHALTSLHAMCEIHHLVHPDTGFDDLARSATLPWWSALFVAGRACALLTESTAPEALAAYDHALGVIDSLDALVLASVQSDDTHDVKVAVSLRRLVDFGLLEEDEAIRVGTSRLAAAQLL